MDKFNEFYMLQTKAKDLERKGLEEQALEIYLDIIKNFHPNNDFSYDRAATILEKKHRFDESLVICSKAIELINKGDITGSVNSFNNKIERITTKLSSDKSFKKTKEKEDFKFTIPGFREHNRIQMILASIYFLGTLLISLPNKYYQYIFFVSLIFAIDYFWISLGKVALKKPFLKTFLVFLISASLCIVMAITTFTDNKMNLDIKDGKSSISDEPIESGSGSGSSNNEEETDFEKDPPEIPERYIELVTASGNLNHEVENTFIVLEERNLFFDLLVEPGTSDKNAKRIAEDLIYEIGGLMVSEGLYGPDNKTYGEVYNYYTATITISTEFEENFITGSLNKKETKISWENQ